jgi:hypothetical protein
MHNWLLPSLTLVLAMTRMTDLVRLMKRLKISRQDICRAEIFTYLPRSVRFRSTSFHCPSSQLQDILIFHVRLSMSDGDLIEWSCLSFVSFEAVLLLKRDDIPFLHYFNQHERSCTLVRIFL